jgi:hypothetical protein
VIHLWLRSTATNCPLVGTACETPARDIGSTVF